MPLYDVVLVPCVLVKVPHIAADSVAEAVEQAKALVDMHALFAQLNCTPPPGVTTVAWTEKFSHYLVDELPLDGDGKLRFQPERMLLAGLPVSGEVLKFIASEQCLSVDLGDRTRGYRLTEIHAEEGRLIVVLAAS
jgi:hypothetical protein